MIDSDDTDDPLIGRTIAGCRIERKLGGGGMGAVYYAIQATLDAPVAFKIIRPEVRQDPHLVAFFEREAREVAKLRGKTARVVQIYEFGWDEKAKLYFISMEYVATSLERHLRAKGRLEEREAARFIKQAAEGLEAARKVHIVHRDIKPDNILLTDDGDVKITDFGLAKNVTATGMSLTQGKTLGTPAYMSPEQAQGDVVDHRTDVYSLGATLYALVTGDTPYKADSAIAMAMKHIQAPVPDARAQGHAISDALNDVIKKAMAKAPDARFDTAGEMARALDDFLSGAPTLNLAKPKPELAPTLPDGQGQTIYEVAGSDVLVLEEDPPPVAPATPPRATTPPPTGDTLSPRDLTVTPTPATQVPAARSRAPLVLAGLAALLLAAVGLAFALGAFGGTPGTSPGPGPVRAAKVRLSAPESPANEARLDAATVRVEGRITGDVEGAWVKVNGAPAQLFRDRYTADLTLADGAQTIELTAGAGAEQTDRLAMAVTVDTTPPVIAIEAPAGDTPTRGADVAVVAAIREPHLQSCRVGGQAAVVTDGRARATVALREGANAIEIVATDAFGHEARHTVSVVRDTMPPVLEIAKPAGLVGAARLRLAGRVQDATAVTLRMGERAIPVEPDGAFAHEVDLVPGDNGLVVMATDAAGNMRQWTARVRYEPLPDGLTEGPTAGVYVCATDGAAMVRLDGPEGRVFVDRDEVTVGQYARFLEAMGDAADTFRPLGWARQSLAGRERHPVVGVSALDAEAYAAWAGKRLPSLAVWMAAAGGAGRRYPWGDAAPDAAHAVFGVEPRQARDGGTGTGERPAGASPCGARDLAGNVAEWTADAAEDAGTRVVKGGGWSDDADALALDAWRSEAANDRMHTVGFRCVWPAPVGTTSSGGR